MNTTFFNVTITVKADDSKAAYTALCDALGHLDADWVTDTYSTDGDESDAKPTHELFTEELE